LAADVQQTVSARRIDALTAVRHHWFVAIFPVALFVAAAVVLGMHRTPRYTATANLSVGHVYVSDPAGIPTIIDAAPSPRTRGRSSSVTAPLRSRAACRRRRSLTAS
jgi:uncharacterized protein involved in exopolysaccharide biosynthesis